MIIPEHIVKEAELKGSLLLILTQGEVRILAKEQADSWKILGKSLVKISDKTAGNYEAVPPSDFRNSPTIEELAEVQGVKPLQNISDLFGTWPGEEDDGFEEEIRRLRQQDIQKISDNSRNPVARQTDL